MQLAVLSPVCSKGNFLVQNVVPQESGESAKVKVKVRVNVHGVFSVASASLIEIVKPAEGEEPMETEQTAKEEEVCVLEGLCPEHTAFFLFFSFFLLLSSWLAVKKPVLWPRPVLTFHRQLYCYCGMLMSC